MALVLVVTGCQTTTPRRDINAVLNDRAPSLMALPGVVGVYVGLRNDGRTECLKVMLGQDDPATRQTIPHTLEGYAVETEVTGLIKPMSR